MFREVAQHHPRNYAEAMDQHHFTDESVADALSRYRTALHDAYDAAEEDTAREEIIAAARDELYEDDIDAHAIVVSLSESERGDRVWNLEEEVLDNE